MKIKVSPEWHPRLRRAPTWAVKAGKVVDYGNVGGDLVIEAFGRWVRFAVYAGSPAGSHIGLWRTRWGALRGLNFRIGRRCIGPCMTIFVHTRREH